MINNIISCPYYASSVMFLIGLAVASFIFEFVCAMLGRKTPRIMKHINIAIVVLYFVLILPLIVRIYGCLIERNII